MDFPELIIYLYDFGIAIGGFLAFVIIVKSGINLMNSQGNPSALSEAKKRIINSLIGLVVLLCSYILLTTINPDIIKIQNIQLGDTQMSLPIFIPGTTTTTNSFGFQEIPIGGTTEALLAGNSSKVNSMPCYEYEHKARDNSGNIIIGNTIDKNGDGKIDSKDVLLDKDVFYCIKLLDDAIKKKAEEHLNYLIMELDNYMKQCSCTNCYSQPLEEPAGYNCKIPPKQSSSSSSSSSYTSVSKCPYCAAFEVRKDCGCRGGVGGVEQAVGGNPFKMYGTFKQYKYDPCQSRLKIDCKRQEIAMLVNGAEPDENCFTEGYIERDIPRKPLLLTFEEAEARLNQFQAYFENKVLDLEAAEKIMKNQEGAKITLAEFNKVQNEENQNGVSKSVSSYSGVRYCTDFQCKRDVKGNCLEELELTKEKRICEIKDNKEHFLFDGDPATFYFNPNYTKATEDILKIFENKVENKTCSVNEGDINKKQYSGTIPIGEAVDDAEAWGKEVTRAIQGMEEDVRGIGNKGISISNLPPQCDCGRCKNENPGGITICFSPCCAIGENACNCFCPSYSCLSCLPCEPSALIPGALEHPIEPCYPMSYCYIMKPAPRRNDPVSEEQKYVCPYYNFDDTTNKESGFCTELQGLYGVGSIDASCFEATKDEEEQLVRERELAKIGYVQRFKTREKILFSLANIPDMKDDELYESIGSVDLIGRVCPSYAKPKEDMSCNPGASFNNIVKTRYSILEKLSLSRKKLTGCITGYNKSYKDDAVKTRIFNCYEAIDLQMLKSYVILPRFPNPKAADYYNCYPFNVSEEVRKACYYNKDRPGTETDPGCKMLTEDYMDNYYCCE